MDVKTSLVKLKVPSRARENSNKSPSPHPTGGQTGSMPRNVQLDVPGTLPPGMVWGIARGRIVADQADGGAIVAWNVGVSTSGISKALSRAGK